MSLANRQERERAKHGLQCPECWGMNTTTIAERFICRSCGEQWDKSYFGEDERED